MRTLWERDERRWAQGLTTDLNVETPGVLLVLRGIGSQDSRNTS